MLDIETAREIGINACIDRLGRDFVLENKDFATKAFGESEDGVFCFVGVDKEYNAMNSDNPIILDSCSKFAYRASCNVNLEDGKITFIED
jgi:hypothetical protein